MLRFIDAIDGSNRERSSGRRRRQQHASETIRRNEINRAMVGDFELRAPSEAPRVARAVPMMVPCRRTVATRASDSMRGMWTTLNKEPPMTSVRSIRPVPAVEIVRSPEARAHDPSTREHHALIVDACNDHR